MNENTPGFCFSGFLIMMLMPRLMNGLEKSITRSRSDVIVSGAIARSAFCSRMREGGGGGLISSPRCHRCVSIMPILRHHFVNTCQHYIATVWRLCHRCWVAANLTPAPTHTHTHIHNTHPRRRSSPPPPPPNSTPPTYILHQLVRHADPRPGRQLLASPPPHSHPPPPHSPTYVLRQLAHHAVPRPVRQLLAVLFDQLDDVIEADHSRHLPRQVHRVPLVTGVTDQRGAVLRGRPQLQIRFGLRR